MISVIIPAYNAANTIQECLNSVFNQTYKDIEVIVVNDGSTDDLALTLTNCQHQLTILHQDNQGAPSARNYGFSVSHGEYLLFLDADIIAKPQMLERMLTALEKDKSASFAYSSFKWGWKKFKLFPFDVDRLRKMPYIHTSSLIRRDAFPKFDESLKKFQDWDLYLTIAERGGRGIYIPEVLFTVKTKGTMSSWFPKILFKFPFKTKIVRQEIDRYDLTKKIIYKKHGI